MEIVAPRDSGNIEVVELGPGPTARLRIRPDTASSDLHWFYFEVRGARGIPCTLHLVNAASSSFPAGWQDYRAVCSADGEQWLRVDTAYRDGVLTLRDVPAAEVVRYAAFAPYPWARHQRRVADWAAVDGIAHDVIGSTLRGRPLDRLVLQGPAGAPVCWVIARQHPGEPMAEWTAEGLVERWIAGPRPPVTLCVVPCCNPDGVVAGHLRTNEAGVDLNRAWAAPDPQSCPEVVALLAAMQHSGVALCLDVHGDEAMPWCFTSGPEGVPGIPDAVIELHQRFRQALHEAFPPFQWAHGYGETAPGRANLAVCKNQVAVRHRCLAMTLEQPFKDDAGSPDSRTGWSPARAAALGAGCLSAIDEIWPALMTIDGQK